MIAQCLVSKWNELAGFIDPPGSTSDCPVPCELRRPPAAPLGLPCRSLYSGHSGEPAVSRKTLASQPTGIPSWGAPCYLSEWVSKIERSIWNLILTNNILWAPQIPNKTEVWASKAAITLHSQMKTILNIQLVHFMRAKKIIRQK